MSAEVVKCLENIFPSCFHEVMDSSGRLLYHVIAPFPESGREESAFDGTSDPSVVKEHIDVLDVLVRIYRVVIGP